MPEYAHREIRPAEIKRDKLVVEVGSWGMPAAFHSRRGIKPDEHYVSANKKEKLRWGKGVFMIENQALWEARNFKDKKNFSAINIEDGQSMPFPDGTVDELIYNNVFGSHYSPDDDLTTGELLREAGRVLAKDGEIHITETTTPSFVPKDWFIGGRPGEPKNDAAVEINQDYFNKFGLVGTKVTTNEQDILKYRWRYYEDKPHYPNAFTLTLKKKK